MYIHFILSLLIFPLLPSPLSLHHTRVKAHIMTLEKINGGTDITTTTTTTTDNSSSKKTTIINNVNNKSTTAINNNNNTNGSISNNNNNYNYNTTTTTNNNNNINNNNNNNTTTITDISNTNNTSNNTNNNSIKNMNKPARFHYSATKRQSSNTHIRLSTFASITSSDNKNNTNINDDDDDDSSSGNVVGVRQEEGGLLLRRRRATVAQRLELLDAHNRHRREVQARDMMFMTWDETLARGAQKHVDNCVFNHSSGDLRPADTGENIFAFQGYEGSISATDVVEVWYKEIDHYNYNNNICNGSCLHYLQLVWANSDKLGCALSPRCRPLQFPSGNSWDNAFMIICQYSHSVFRNQRPYQKGGTVCSACDRRLVCDRALCRWPDCERKRCGSGILMLDTCECNCNGTGSTGYWCQSDSGSRSLGVFQTYLWALLLGMCLLVEASMIRRH